jgi:hypothetical protein
MKSFLIQRVSNGWIVRPYGSEVRDDRTQAFVFSTVPDLIAALPILLIEPVTQGPCPPPHLDATPAHLFNCPDCSKYMTYSDHDTWSCHRCATRWTRYNLTPLQSNTGPEE